MRENGARQNIFSATKDGRGGGRRERGASSAFMVLLFFERETERGNLLLTEESNIKKLRDTLPLSI